MQKIFNLRSHHTEHALQVVLREMQAVFASENVLFCQAVDEFKKKPTAKRQRHLYTHFVAKTAPLQVNVLV